jgi:hypothetical protein
MAGLSVIFLRVRQMKYWEIIADQLSKNGWSWGCSSQIDSLAAADLVSRFGGSRGEVHVYDATGATIERKIVIDGRGQYQKVRE